MKLFNKLADKLRVVPALLVMMAFAIALTGCGKQPDEDEDIEEIVTDEGDYAPAPETPNYTLPDVALEENAYADVNELVNRYFTAMSNGDTDAIRAMQSDIDEKNLIKFEKESAYVDEFSNIKVYTKPGPYSNSYVAFVYYEIKFKDIGTMAPGLNTLYIRTNDEGALYIDTSADDQKSEYISGIIAQTDVADLFSMVTTKYGEAIDSDESLKTFMEGLTAKLDEEVSQAMAELEKTEGGDGQSETASEDGQATSTENVTAQKVKAIDTVNVRSSDSENADRIGQIAQGDTITRYEVKENGWSRVDYNGKDGYVKSEFLADLDAEIPSEDTASNESSTETKTESNESKNLTAKGYVTIKETVNVRKSASQDSEKLGVAYENENYDLIMEQADGWCKIKYNGKTGYVKTEFVK